jgi:tetratricopeptide (TPR) repeat protein
MNRQQRRAAIRQGGAGTLSPPPGGIRQIFSEALRRHQNGRLAEAEQLYRQVLSIEPRHADSLHLLGVIACDAGHGEVGIDLIGKAIAIDPKVAHYHFNLAVALQDRKQLDLAIASYRRAIALTPNYAMAHNNLGNALRDLGKADDAIAAYRKAFEFKPDFQQARNNLGTALRSRGRFDEAGAVYAEALKWGKDVGPAYQGLSAIRKFKEIDRPLIADMEAALDDPLVSMEDKGLIGFALGKVFDDLGDYETAIGHFDAANRLEHQSRDFDRAAFSASIDRLRGVRPQPAQGTSHSELPVLIIGMPRSGTTLVEQILASHPKVAAGGELTFWLERTERLRNGEIAVLGPDDERNAVRDYLTLLRRISPTATRVTDKMPYNFLTVGTVHALFPRTHIIHCRRSPIDTALSIYVTRLAGAHHFAYDRGDIVYYYRDYLRLMEHWRAILPPDRFIEIDYEELIADQEGVTRRMIAFCGLDWDQACLDFHKTDRPIVTASAWQARQPVYRSSTERWRNYEPWLGELRALLS